ncbi:hypothetical protein AgCh_029515 [Apium graveolens]
MSKIPYASAIGSIMYAVLCTRPDVAYSISVTSRYQSNPAEAEYIAASEDAKEAVWMRKFVSELGVVPSVEEPIVLYYDNNAAIAQAKEPRSHRNSKHVLRRFHLIREIVERGDVNVERVDTHNNVANPLTKPLSQSHFDRHKDKMDLHFVQDFLANSEIGYALAQPQAISSQQVLTFLRTGHFDDGGATGTPSIVFEVNDVEHVVTPGAVRKALHLPEGCTFSTVEDPVLQQLMASLGYESSLGKLGQLKRANIRKEWSFFFDCITKAFANKCSNFDAISIMSQQIGYALIHHTHFDFASVVLGFIGDRMTEDNVVYFARLCQLIYSFSCADKPQPTTNLIPPFKLAKRAFNDLLNVDMKKQVVRPLQIPQLVKQILVNAYPQTYISVYPNVQPTNTSQPPQHPSDHTTSTQTPQPSQPQPTQPSIRTCFKPSQSSQPQSSAHYVHPSSARATASRSKKVQPTEPIISAAEKVSSQKDIETGISKSLKRPRTINSDDTAPTVSSKAKRFKTLAKRPADSGKGMEAATKEGGQESLISEDPIEAHNSPSADPDLHATHHSPLHEPETTHIPTPPVSPVHVDNQGPSDEIDIHNLEVPQNLGGHQGLAIDQNLVGDQHLEDDVEVSIASHTVLLSEDVDDADSISSDAANIELTGEAAVNVDADTAGPSGHAPQQTVHKADLVKKFVTGEAPVP